MSAPELTCAFAIMAAVSAGRFVVGSLGFVASVDELANGPRMTHATPMSVFDASLRRAKSRRCIFSLWSALLGSFIFLLGLIC